MSILFLSVVTHVVFLVIKVCLYFFAVLTTTTVETTVSTTTIENTLVRPWVREGVARVTAGTSVAGMWRERGVSTVSLEVRVEDVSQILGTDNVLSGAQAILLKPAVQMDLAATLEMKEGAQEARSPSFAILEL